MMRNLFSPPAVGFETADPAPDRELDGLLAANAWLDSLEPFYIEWELIWLM